MLGSLAKIVGLPPGARPSPLANLLQVHALLWVAVGKADCIFQRAARENEEGKEACPLEWAESSCLTADHRAEQHTTTGTVPAPLSAGGLGGGLISVWLAPAPDLPCVLAPLPGLGQLRARSSHGKGRWAIGRASHTGDLQPTAPTVSANSALVKTSPKVKLSVSGAGKCAVATVCTVSIR